MLGSWDKESGLYSRREKCISGLRSWEKAKFGREEYISLLSLNSAWKEVACMMFVESLAALLLPFKILRRNICQDEFAGFIYILYGLSENPQMKCHIG